MPPHMPAKPRPPPLQLPRQESLLPRLLVALPSCCPCVWKDLLTLTLFRIHPPFAGASVSTAAAAKIASTAAAVAAKPHRIWTDPNYNIPVSLAKGYESECHMLLVALLERFAGAQMLLACTFCFLRRFSTCAQAYKRCIHAATAASYKCFEPSCDLCYPSEKPAQATGLGNSEAEVREWSTTGHEEGFGGSEVKEIPSKQNGSEQSIPASGVSTSQPGGSASRPNTGILESAQEGAGELRSRGQRHSSSVGGMLVAIRSYTHTHTHTHTHTPHTHAHTQERARAHTHNTNTQFDCLAMPRSACACAKM